jgi:hypothetical protein
MVTWQMRPGPLRGYARYKMLLRVYEGFLELPVVVVLAALWLVGLVLLGPCALMAYLVGSVLLRVVV